MVTCEEFTDRVSDYLDDRVPFGERIGLCMHRLLCVRCRNYYRQLQEIVEFVEEYGDPPESTPPPKLRRELLDRYREKTQGA